MAKKRRLQDRFNQPAGWQWGAFTNARGKDLRYGHSGPDKPKAHIVFVEGLAGYTERNFELANDFNKNACAFWTFDRQGQGMSGRFLSNKFKQHSTGFAHDAADLNQFVRDIVPHDGAPVILFGHSTGGMIALLALHDQPELFSAAVLTSPLLGMQNPAARNHEKFWAHLSMPKPVLERYIPGGNSVWARNHKFHRLKQHDYSSDPDRMKISDYWQRLCKDLRTGSPTMGWAQEACRSIMKIREPSYLKDIKTPLIIFTAGQDKLVNNRYTFEAMKHLPNASYVHFKKGKHELPMETDDIRNRILRDTLALIKNQP